MCLDTVDKETKDFKYGWKVFRKERGKLYSVIYDIRYKAYPVNEWISDKKRRKILSNCLTYYPKGFHFYKTREQARRNCRAGEIVKKIKVKNIVASGTEYLVFDNRRTVGVAKEMLIIE